MPDPAAKPDDTLTIIGREIAATQGALLALASLFARHGDPTAVVQHLVAIKVNAEKEANSAAFVRLIDQMIEVVRPPLH
ncbi:MAG: hypothetical protein EXR27_03470 [Betaproteobacteria bacterium]|nr:hypothetical protein [Betaproteobacteria bacterium]